MEVTIDGVWHGGEYGAEIYPDVERRASRGPTRTVGTPRAGKIPRPRSPHRPSPGWRRRPADRGAAPAGGEFSRPARRPRGGDLAALWSKGRRRGGHRLARAAG